MPVNPVSVVIIDEQLLFRRMLSNYLVKCAHMDVVLEGGQLKELLRAGKRMMFDVLVMDIPATGAHEIICRIKAMYPLSKILLLSMTADIEWVSELLEMGIYGCVSKRDSPEELRDAILTIASDRIYRNQLFTEALYCHHRNNYSGGPDIAVPLTDREKLLLRLMWEDKNNREIADEILLSVRSVEKLKQELREKLQVRSAVGLLRYAIESKICTIG
ncbi:response regulator transcription factor [Chitinophaga solisilvae]|uniref:Response regulator transcription factor n=1 Tax=Chitinophaga solisilvae TaxID=1233460 RepID=A0A433WPW7_9BACT|nr:response regulator transcription factor [Chitinophaga solisilvae]NSL90993.1 response regulator transcription factor [Chitinophaga solisilvae]